ncbi:MAG: DUF2971 domain-containing protein [Gallionella sp.]|nr:DUF2971 domain-containing protein [Gallionella sp.]
MRVYYLTGAQFALSNLALRRIKIARFSDLNDPFELLGVDIGNREHRTAFRETKDQLNESKGLICFSRSWGSTLMWGHYAEKHTGICLGFDVQNKFLEPVIYSKGLLKISIDQNTGEPKLTEQFMKRLLLTKFYDWKYENEMRLFVDLDHKTVESGKYFYPFSDNLELREVILGPRCELPIEGVRNIVADLEQPVTVIKSRIAFTRFEVIENRSASVLNSH